MQDCVDCRGIKPMPHLREGLGDEPFAVMPGRGTADTILAVRQRMKKYSVKQDSIFITVFIIDLEKKRHRYYDRVTRQEEVLRRKSEKEVQDNV